jgi:LIM domain kinase 1
MITVNYANSKPLWEFMENTQEQKTEEPVIEMKPEEPVVEMKAEEPVVEMKPEEVLPESAELPVVSVPAPAPVAVTIPVIAKEPASEPAPCFPMREYDMTKVEGRPIDEYQSVSF